MRAIGNLGLAEDAEGLSTLLDDVWDKVNTEGIVSEDKDEKKRNAMVMVLDRAVGAELEGNIDEVRKAAS